jgi:oxygen-dependent protoporphyrinogen oxidase
LPQYAVGHTERIGRVRAAVAEVNALEVCGATYEGLGVAACVAGAQQAAERLLTSLPDHESPGRGRMAT